MRALPLILLVSLACSEAALQPVPPPEPVPVDNRLSLAGTLCTEPADVTPFPVKLLFVVDQSTSLQCTDSRNRRFGALRRVVDDLYVLPNVAFGYVAFASWSNTQAFTRDRDALRPLLDPGQGLGPATDYQGALASTVRILEQDMLASGPADRARTRYVVVFVSDGQPEPRCRAGCEDDRERCGNGRDDDGDGLVDGADLDCADIDDASLRPDVLYGVCNTDREIPDDVYVDFAGRCPAYNQPEQILQRIDDIRALELVYGAGDVVFNTVFLSATQATIEEVCPDAAASFGYAADPARDLLRGMARAGGGTFRDVNLDVEDDTFLEFDFASLRSPYAVTDFVAHNASGVGGAGAIAADTDGDGLSDDAERADRMDPLNVDTDGDGYGDLLEVRLRSAGFDPLDPSAPARACEQIGDRDGDGLRDCEEAYLGTDPHQPDSDGDRLADGHELRVGTDPLVADALGDPDFDGAVSRDEIRGGSDPFVPDADRLRREGTRYALEDRGEQPVPDRETGAETLRRCYDFTIEDLRLATTARPQDRGRNRLYMTFAGEPVGLSGGRSAMRRGCVEATFVDGNRKVPASGQVDLTQAGWTAQQARLDRRLDEIAQCMGFVDPLLLRRFDVDDLMDACVPRTFQVGRFLFDKPELQDLLKRLLKRDLTVQGPITPSDLFWPIEQFDPDQHCFKPWEYERLEDLLDGLVEACWSCEALRRDGGLGPDQGLMGDGGLDAGTDGAMP
jgi:hypothetical protein